jgi:hypothetical protein
MVSSYSNYVDVVVTVKGLIMAHFYDFIVAPELSFASYSLLVLDLLAPSHLEEDIY